MRSATLRSYLLGFNSTYEIGSIDEALVDDSLRWQYCQGPRLPLLSCQVLHNVFADSHLSQWSYCPPRLLISYEPLLLPMCCHGRAGLSDVI